jgi:integrase
MRERRKTKVQPSQQNRRKSRRVRAPERKYTKDAYNRAIQRACEAAFNMPKELQRASRRLTPSQVRRLRDQGGESAIELAEEERQRFLKLAAAWRAENCWSPNQLRHAAGTEVRRKFGLEAAQVVLGHAKADVTQVYAERDMALAAAIMQKIG